MEVTAAALQQHVNEARKTCKIHRLNPLTFQDGEKERVLTRQVGSQIPTPTQPLTQLYPKKPIFERSKANFQIYSSQAKILTIHLSKANVDNHGFSQSLATKSRRVLDVPTIIFYQIQYANFEDPSI